jgi:glutamate--cysteine ligase
MPGHDGSPVLPDLSDAEDFVSGICFKTGPPTHTGVELEWTVHDVADPTLPIDLDRLRTALGPHAPLTIDPTSSHDPLPQRGTVTVEPGGQVEISTAPHPSLAALDRATSADIDHLTELLSLAGLTLGEQGIDPHRRPRPAVDTPRYRAMRSSFDRRGRAGQTMMYSTAGLQVCLDAGEPHQVAPRWQAVHTLGPTLLAAFATARWHAGQDTGWASARMAAWFDIDPCRTRPVWTPTSGGDPAAEWARYALAAPVICVRDDPEDWTAPPGVTFGDWIAGALPRPPTEADLDYHLSTLFPPVRPRGYLEIRYLDTQPNGEWIAPTALLAALMVDGTALSVALEACEPVAHLWREAARHGVAHPGLARAATVVLDVASNALDRTDLPSTTRKEINQIVERRLAVAERNLA